MVLLPRNVLAHGGCLDRNSSRSYLGHDLLLPSDIQCLEVREPREWDLRGPCCRSVRLWRVEHHLRSYRYCSTRAEIVEAEGFDEAEDWVSLIILLWIVPQVLTDCSTASSPAS